MASSPAPDPSVTCDLCFKSYQRRDLLLRHRRRCTGPSKPGTRRKACNACVAAKTRCCYSQPTCARCAKRNIPCQYVNSAAHSPDHNDQNALTDSPSHTRPSSPSRSSSPSKNMFQQPDLSDWGDHMISWPMDTFDVSMTDGVNSMSLLQDVAPSGHGMTIDATGLSPSTQALLASSQANEDSMLALSSTAWNIPFPPPSDTQSYPSSSISLSTPSTSLVRQLGDYPSCLLKDINSSPILHRTLFSDPDSDLTSLPRTAMAICSANLVSSRDGSRFAKKAMDAERERLIEAFPSYQSVQQWDALHAMLLYETLELKQALGEDGEDWKQRPRSRGFHSPFILKMVKCYSQLYPELRNGDVNVFSRPGSTPHANFTSAWGRWKLTETARRTIFLANMVNFFSSYDHATGKQMAYYEPLDDELLLNMPLPCSQAAWMAADEHEWRQAMESQPPPMTAHRLSIDYKNVAPDGAALKDSLKSLFSRFSKDYIQAMFNQNVGFEDSDTLRGLVVLCACEQFL